MPDIVLNLPEGFPYPKLSPKVHPQDGMYEGNTVHYLEVGLSAINVIDRALAKRAVATPVKSILDIPCGYGRVTRTLRCRFDDARITACDIEKEGVDFCAQTFDARGVYSAPHFDDLDLRDQFDLIFVGSLITHLDERAIASFFSFLKRHLSDVGIAVVSSHGPFVAGWVAGRIRQSILDKSAGTNLKLVRNILPSYFKRGFGFAAYQNSKVPGGRYGFSICSKSWLRQMVNNAGMAVIAYDQHLWDNRHDVISFKRL